MIGCNLLQYNMSEQSGNDESTQQLQKIELVIPSDLIDNLKKAETSQIKQKLVDGVFTEARRKEMWQQASKDRKGRPVRYYRKMKEDKVFSLLEKGNQTSLDYFDNPDEVTDIVDIRSLLLRYISYRRIEDVPIKDLYKMANQQLLEVIQRVDHGFPSLKDGATYASVQQVVSQLPLDFVANIHTGSTLQKFSPLLSLSVGGPISERLNTKRPYLEYIIPDDRLILHPYKTKQEIKDAHAIDGEREVFVTELDRNWISKAYFDPDAYYEDLIVNPNSNISHYYEKPKIGSPTVEYFRWTEPVLDCLPASLALKAIDMYGRKD